MLFKIVLISVDIKVYILKNVFLKNLHISRWMANKSLSAFSKIAET